MSDTKQLVIMKRICTLVEGITPVNGYDYDLTGKVYRGRVVFGPETVVPFVSVLESIRPDPSPDYAGHERMIREETWELLLQGWARTDVVHPTDALYGLKASLEKRLARIAQIDGLGNPVFPDDYRLGRLITRISIGPGVVRAATPQTGGVEAVYLPVLIGYVVNVSDPWALS